MFPFFLQPENADPFIRIRFIKISDISIQAAVIRNAQVTGKEGQRRSYLQKSRTHVEVHMPQDVYIYDPDIPVPEDVRHVEIPEGITEIGSYAFAECTRLQSVTIPNSVKKISDCVFKGCLKLQSITIPNSVTEIGNEAFFNCSGLQSVAIPDNVTEIGNNVFRNCSDMRSVTIPDSVAKIGFNAFRDCSGLRSVTIPNSVTTIAQGAFYGCSGLRSITVPDNVRDIGNYAFSFCTGLQSVVMSHRITEIKNFVFECCPNLRSFIVPDSVVCIQNGAFAGCSGLENIVMPDSMTAIGDLAFAHCSGLRSVTIPDSVTKIGHDAFKRCTGLQSVVLPSGITEIDYLTFTECTGLKSVRIPEKVTYIGFHAFDGCTGLQSVTFTNGLRVIGNGAFEKCSSIRSVTLPDGLLRIDDYAFGKCSGLESVTIPDGVTWIGDCAFAACSALRSVTIPNGVTKISHGLFGECSRLRSVTIPANITELKRSAFFDCEDLQSVMFCGYDIRPFINIDGYGVDTFKIIRMLAEHRLPINENIIKRGIEKEHRGQFSQWIREYPVFGEMNISPAMKPVDEDKKNILRKCFLSQERTGRCVPKILEQLTITACVCGIPADRLAGTFDIAYTKDLIKNRTPLVPAEACRCYFSKSVCESLIRKNKISVMAEAVGLYNASHQKDCYKSLMQFILSHQDTKTEDLQYAADHAEEIPMQAGTTLAQVKQHRIYTENLTEVTKIETKYGKTVPEFRLSDCLCNIEPVGVTYDGMTARVLDLSDAKDIALAAGLGELTNCCQCLGKAGETAMMHGFLNPDAGFWVIEDSDGNIKAQAEIWIADEGALIFDNIEFADTDSGHRAERVNQLRSTIAAWAIESGYKNIIMGCGYNELGTETMEKAPIPNLVLTPAEVFALQCNNEADVFFDNVDAAEKYMQTPRYEPENFVYTDTDERCVYIKKDGTVSDYLMEGYDRNLTEKHPASGHETEKERDNDTACK